MTAIVVTCRDCATPPRIWRWLCEDCAEECRERHRRDTGHRTEITTPIEATIAEIRRAARLMGRAAW